MVDRKCVNNGHDKMQFRYIIMKVATNTNLKEIFDCYEKQQRKLKKYID